MSSNLCNTFLGVMNIKTSMEFQQDFRHCFLTFPLFLSVVGVGSGTKMLSTMLTGSKVSWLGGLLSVVI